MPSPAADKCSIKNLHPSPLSSRPKSSKMLGQASNGKVPWPAWSYRLHAAQASSKNSRNAGSMAFASLAQKGHEPVCLTDMACAKVA
eukprot:CAMPEP_0198543588 /NCGR_PEP_ID=MMETSP1462-20131121/59747_1 /TAXON_ID=1333877 /ORGANISM="Brandtodinium nutriculum, Strain RCC3387" /LENGTH=86 /DNA_ID=CAMNT_0044273875 /DNA_START=21 /DNA_END=278 /DNA_ORIENTATION=+